MKARDERGAVTAELAMGLPLLVGLTVALCWMLSLGITQVRLVDAARESARAVARGDEPAAAVSIGRRVAGPDSRVSVSRDGAEVRASAVTTVRGLGGWLAVLPDVTLHARSTALVEDTG